MGVSANVTSPPRRTGPVTIISNLVGALLGVAGVVLAGAPAANAVNPAPIVVAHRGGAYAYPENTYPGMVAAAQAGQILETDVRFTSDHVAVLAHDQDTTRVFYCSGHNYMISVTPFEVLNRDCLTRHTLSRTGAQYHLARYTSVLFAVKGIRNVRVWPEIKTQLDDADARRFLGPLITDGLITRARVTSFDGPSLKLIRRAASYDFNVTSMHTLLYEYGQGVALSVALSYGVDAIGPSYYTVHVQIGAVQNAHDRGVGVAVYNAEDQTRWANLRSLGVDWTITNHPTAYQVWARS